MAPTFSEEDVLNLKRQALQAKKAGDIEAAKNFLRQAKEVQQQIVVQQQQQAQGDVTTTSSSSPAAIEKSNDNGTTPATTTTTTTPTTTPKQEVMEDPINKAIDEANLDELTQKPGTVTFSDAELADIASMQDFQSCGVDIPSETVYQERILETKRSALAQKKAGNIPAAKQHLNVAKQLERAVQALYHPNDDTANAVADGHIADEDLNPEELQLLEELKQYTRGGGGGGSGGDGTTTEDDGFLDQLFGSAASGTSVLDLDDLDDVMDDPSLLKDMMEAGMEIPNVEDVRQDAIQKKTLAIQFKKNGDLVSAKAALQESKRLDAKATQLEGMLKAIEKQKSSGGSEDDDADPEAALERMMQEENNGGTKTKKEEKIETPKLKSSAEYKIQAVQCKQQGKKEEAIAALRLYKQALAAEESAKAAEQRKEAIETLHKESNFATEQSRLFAYYHYILLSNNDNATETDNSSDNKKRLGIAATTLHGWRKYARDCSSQAMTLEMEGDATSSSTATITNLQRCDASAAVLKVLPNDSFVGTLLCNPNDARIEIAILELMDLHTNRTLRETLQLTENGKDDGATVPLPSPDDIRVEITLHLPPNVDTPDEDVKLEFRPTSSNETERTIVFFGKNSGAGGSQHFLNAERGSGRFAKLLARRLATRRRCMTVDVYYTHKIVTKGMLLLSKTVKKDILLGSAGCELKNLLDTNYIAMDLPLIEPPSSSSRKKKKEMAGTLRMAIRTGTPFGATSTTKTVDSRKKTTSTTDEPMTATTGIVATPEKNGVQEEVPLEAYQHLLLSATS